MFGAIVCGIKDGKFYGTIYGYPADESADGKEQEIGDGIMTVLSTKKYDNLYKIDLFYDDWFFVFLYLDSKFENKQGTFLL